MQAIFFYYHVYLFTQSFFLIIINIYTTAGATGIVAVCFSLVTLRKRLKKNDLKNNFYFLKNLLSNDVFASKKIISFFSTES